MRTEKAMRLMSALSQGTRLEVFRRLVGRLPAGMTAGEIAVATGVAPNALSAHLSIMSHAGLVRSARSGRNVTYRAVPANLRALVAFLDAIDGRSPAEAAVAGDGDGVED